MLRPISLILMAIAFSTSFTARPVHAMEPIVPVLESCILESAAYHNVPVSVILGLMATETGVVGAISYNTNGTYDIGPMQINSSWLPKLRKHGISERALRYNGCVNVAIGAWIIGDLLKKYPMWEAIGYYHSRTPHLSEKYKSRVYNKMKRLDPSKVVRYANGVKQ